MRKLAILRGGTQVVRPSHYNIQEVGLGRFLETHGWEVLVISPGSAEASFEASKHVRWVELPRRGITRRLSWASGVSDLLARHQPDVIQVQDLLTPATVAGVVLAKRLNVPLVLSLGDYGSPGSARDALAIGAARAVRPHVAAVLCKSRMSQAYADRLGLRSLHYAPVGLDVTHYRDGDTDSADTVWVRKLIQLKREGKRLLLHVGRLDKGDNALFLLRVLRDLPEAYRLVLLGGPKEHTQELAAQMGIRDRVLLTGTVPNASVGMAYRNADLYLACSEKEPFGLSIAESIYFGCPVVAHATGGALDTIDDGVTGKLVYERTSKMWARVIEELFSRDNIVGLRQRTRAFAPELAWDRRGLAYRQVYEQVVNVRCVQAK